MEEEEYEDYLVDKAKELLNEQMESKTDKESKSDTPDFGMERKDLDKKAGKESTSKIPFSWDPRELKHLTNNRTNMSNEEMREFLKKDSEFHDKFEEDDWKGFSRWEERFILQRHSTMNKEEIAEQLDRSTSEVEAKIHMMGLKYE